MKKQSSIFKTLLFAVIFFVSGLMAYLYITKPIAEDAEASKAWPTVEGVITHAELDKSRNHDRKEMYSADIKYNYVVDGKQYSSSVVSAADSKTSMKNSVKMTLRKYAEGKKVVVHYDPEFPNSAVLETGTGLLYGLLLKMPLLFCVIAILMAINAFKRLFFGR